MSRGKWGDKVTGREREFWRHTLNIIWYIFANDSYEFIHVANADVLPLKFLMNAFFNLKQNLTPVKLLFRIWKSFFLFWNKTLSLAQETLPQELFSSKRWFRNGAFWLFQGCDCSDVATVLYCIPTAECVTYPTQKVELLSKLQYHLLLLT